MSVCADGSRTKTRKSRKAGRKKMNWPRRVMASATKFQIPGCKIQGNPKQQTSIGAARREFGVWALGIVWDGGLGMGDFSQSLSGQVLFLLRPVFCGALQFQFARENPAAHFVEHGGLLRTITRVRWRNDGLRRGQKPKHSPRQRVAREPRRVAARGKIAEPGELALVFPGEKQFEELDGRPRVFRARIDEKT